MILFRHHLWNGIFGMQQPYNRLNADEQFGCKNYKELLTELKIIVWYAGLDTNGITGHLVP